MGDSDYRVKDLVGKLISLDRNIVVIVVVCGGVVFKILFGIAV